MTGLVTILPLGASLRLLPDTLSSRDMMLLKRLIFETVSADNNVDSDLRVLSKEESGGPLLPVLFIMAHFFLNFTIALKVTTNIYCSNLRKFTFSLHFCKV